MHVELLLRGGTLPSTLTFTQEEERTVGWVCKQLNNVCFGSGADLGGPVGGYTWLLSLPVGAGGVPMPLHHSAIIPRGAELNARLAVNK
jgi:hypothetical protein